MILPVAVSASHGTTQNSSTTSQSQVKPTEVETEKSEAAEHSQGPANASTTGVANASDNSVLNDSTTTPTTTPATGITKDEAIKIAQAQHPGVDVKETESENEHGTTSFEVEFVDGSKVVVGSDGTVLSKKIVTAPATNNQGTNNSNSNSNSNRGHSEAGETETHGGHGQN